MKEIGEEFIERLRKANGFIPAICPKCGWAWAYKGWKANPEHYITYPACRKSSKLKDVVKEYLKQLSSENEKDA